VREYIEGSGVLINFDVLLLGLFPTLVKLCRKFHNFRAHAWADYAPIIHVCVNFHVFLDLIRNFLVVALLTRCVKLTASFVHGPAAFKLVYSATVNLFEFN
jgi:hypothetical protein